MPDEVIHIVSYDPSWPERFAREKKILEATLGAWITDGVHHVGSTSIPGMSAKPIIDIMVGVKNLSDAKACIPLLEQIQYCYYPYKPDEMIWLCKPSFSKRTHHLHLMEASHPQWKAKLAFRDYLKSHPNAKEEYRALKAALAETYHEDREAYTEAKGEFVTKIVNKAL